MKKLLNILLLVAISFAILSGCSNVDEKLFPKSSSERVQGLIDDAYRVLTSSEEGWYFNYYNGWDVLKESGGYWFWCKFYTADSGDYMVDAAFELDITYYNNDALHTDGNTIVNQYSAGTTQTSQFSIGRESGAVLNFDVYNGVLTYFVRPNASRYQGLQGDSKFIISSVTDNVVTVKGIRTGKLMHFYRKTDGKSVEEIMPQLGSHPGADVRFGDGFEAVINNANLVNVSLERSKRTVTISHDVSLGYEQDPVTGEIVEKIERQSEKMLYTPRLDGTGIDLYEPFTLSGSPVSGFSYDAGTNSFISNDAGQSILLKTVDIPLGEFYPTLLWILSLDDSSDSFKALWEQAEQYFEDDDGTTDNPRDMDLLAMLAGNMMDWLEDPRPGFTFVFRFNDSQEDIQFVVDFTPNGEDEITFSFRANGAGADPGTLGDYVRDVANAIFSKSPYTISTDPAGEEWMKFTSKSDNSFYFVTRLF